MYELSTGTVPFQGADPTTVTHAQVYTPPEPPRSREEDIPEWLETVILKCLAKAPEDRFQSAEELGEALQSHKQVVALGAQVPPSVHAPPEAQESGSEISGVPETDEFSYGPDESPKRRKKRRSLKLLWLAAGIVLLGALGVGRFLMMRGAQQQQEETKGMLPATLSPEP